MPTPKLLDQVRNVIRVKHFSLSTERAYVGWIRRFILFHHKKHPKEMAEAEIRQFISHLAVDAKISASRQTVALSALLFLYRDVLKKDLPYVDNIERAQRRKTLPLVLAVAARNHNPGLSPATAGCGLSVRGSWGSATLHPRLIWLTSVKKRKHC